MSCASRFQAFAWRFGTFGRAAAAAQAQRVGVLVQQQPSPPPSAAAPFIAGALAEVAALLANKLPAGSSGSGSAGGGGADAGSSAEAEAEDEALDVDALRRQVLTYLLTY